MSGEPGPDASVDADCIARRSTRAHVLGVGVALLLGVLTLLGACATPPDAAPLPDDVPSADFAESVVTWQLGDVPDDFADLAPPHLAELRTGIVVRDGAPVAGARVSLWDARGECDDITCAFTDARGRFVLATADLEAELVHRRISSHDGGQPARDELLVVQAPDGGFAQVHVPRRADRVSFTRIELGARRLELRLRDELGRPVPDRAVSLRHVASGVGVPELPRSDVDGRLVVATLPAGCYDVRLLSGAFDRIATQVELADDPRSTRFAELVVGASELLLTLREPDGRPAAAAHVNLVPLDVPGLAASESPTPFLRDRLVGTDGTLRLERLPAGRYLVRAARAERCLGEDALYHALGELRLARGEVRRLELQLPACASANAPVLAAGR